MHTLYRLDESHKWMPNNTPPEGAEILTFKTWDKLKAKRTKLNTKIQAKRDKALAKKTPNPPGRPWTGHRKAERITMRVPGQLAALIPGDGSSVTVKNYCKALILKKTESVWEYTPEDKQRELGQGRWPDNHGIGTRVYFTLRAVTLDLVPGKDLEEKRGACKALVVEDLEGKMG